MSKVYNFCNNCGKTGHSFHQCKLPITSIGVISFKESGEGIQYLMIRRKDTLGYVDFLRGKYSLYNSEYIQNIIDEMTCNEKDKLLTKDFDTLWKELWGENIGIQYRSEERISRDKFVNLKNGVIHNDKEYSLKSIIDNSSTGWIETEWGFPKGRRNYQEKDLPAALREFEEETGYSKYSLSIVQNIVPFEEVFTGSNYKSYRHKYYIAMMNDNAMGGEYQCTEVSKIEWKTFTQAKECIRPYNLEKIELLNNINKLLLEYRLYSL
tara:strand:- start:561 stop:1358 length:798 start_codon:yes stop_codon:yes gene_type:complete